MKTTKYTGYFISSDGNNHIITVNTTGFLKAFFLLTAEAIKEDKHFQLSYIIDENGIERKIKDIYSLSTVMFEPYC